MSGKAPRRRAPVELDPSLHPCQTLSPVGIVWVVVHHIPSDQVIQPLDRTGAPNIEDPACRCLVALRQGALDFGR
jgi:hypothetical protein